MATGELALVLARAIGRYIARGSARRPQRPDGLEDPENPASWVGLDYVHDRVLAQLEQQSRYWEDADGRLRLILGIIGVVFAVTLGLLPRGAMTAQAESGAAVSTPLLLPFWVGLLAIVGLALFAGAGLIALIGFWPRSFNGPPAPAYLRKYLMTDERETRLFVLDRMIDAYTANNVWLDRKILAFRWALVIAAIATTALGASVIIQLAQFTPALS